MLIKKAKEENYLEVTGVKFFGEIFKKLTGMSGERGFKGSRFIFENSKQGVEYIIETFPDAEWSSSIEYIKTDLINKKKREEERLANIDEVIAIKDYPEIFKTKPFNHQLKAFEISKDLEHYGLFFEQGCGKTKVIIDNASYLFLENKIEALVIIAPNGVHGNWIHTELPVHCKVDYEPFLWKGNLNKTNKKIYDTVNASNKLRVYSFNIEAFVSKKQQELLKDILKRNRVLFAIDESQSIKNAKAKRTDFFLSISKSINGYKRLMSGTPVTKGLEDFFTQLQFLNEGILGLKSIYSFQAKYCKMVKKTIAIPGENPDGSRKTRSFQQTVGYQNVELLQDKIDTCSMRVLKKDCLDLPPKIYQREFVILTPDQKRIDKEIQEEGISFIKQCKADGTPVTIANVLSRLIKRQQVASGFLLNMEDKPFVELVKPDENPRLLKLKSLVDVISGKIIIWARFTKDIDYIMQMLGNEAVRYDGMVDSDQKETNKYNFQNDESIKYFVAKPIKGLTLTKATTAIYYSNDFDLEKRLQSEDRNHRHGTKEVLEAAGKENILYIDLEAVGTIDSKIIKALRSKKKLADMVLQDPESLFMEN